MIKEVEKSQSEPNKVFIKIKADKQTPQEDIVEFMYHTYRDPYQINSPYDCTGKLFVQFVWLYPAQANNNEHRDYDRYIIEQVWARDI